MYLYGCNKEMKQVSTRTDHKSTFLLFVAYLQIIGIILVVMGHSVHEYPDGEGGKTLLSYRMLYSFHMPLFMFCSGLLMVFTTLRRSTLATFPQPLKFTLNKVKRLLIPFAFLILLVYFPRALMSFMADDEVQLSWEGMLSSFVYSDHLPIPYYWFLQASFILLVSNYALLWIGKRMHVPDVAMFGILICIALWMYVVVPFNTWFFALRNVCTYAIYFILGAVYGAYLERVDSVINWNSIALFITLIVAWVVSFILFEGTKLAVVTAICGIAMAVSVAHILESRNIRVLDSLIGTNYIIFLLSWFFNVASQQVLGYYTDFHWSVYSTLSLITGVLGPVIILKLMQRKRGTRLCRTALLLLGQAVDCDFKAKKAKEYKLDETVK